MATWYAATWTRDDAVAYASSCAEKWRSNGVGKWLAYEKSGGDLVGRGGLSRLAASDPSAAAIDALLADPQWRASRLEAGWAVLSSFRKQGMATEIGKAALSGEIRARGLVENQIDEQDDAPFVVYTTTAGQGSR